MPDSPDATLNEDVLKFIRWSANTREDTTENIGVARDLLARIEAAARPAAPAVAITPAEIRSLMAYVRERWAYADSGYWDQQGDRFSISTAGWSGNESIIAALEANQMFSMLCPLAWRTGGHYVYDVQDWDDNPEPGNRKFVRDPATPMLDKWRVADHDCAAAAAQAQADDLPTEARLREALASLDRISDLFGFHLQRIGYRDEETAEAIAEAQKIISEKLPESSGSSEPSTDEAIREALWSLHGHDFIYGDDGEMQCNWSLHMADFKRDPMPKLLEHITHARLVAAPQSTDHTLLMPPHPGGVYRQSALCSCGGWQWDGDSAILDYKAVLYDHATHQREARAASPKGERASAQAVAPELDEIVKIAAHALCHGKSCDGGHDGDSICPPHGEAALAFAAAYAEADREAGE